MLKAALQSLGALSSSWWRTAQSSRVRATYNEDHARVSRFFGISIRFYYSDHDPPHFHAIYGEFEALIEIETLCVLRGQLPRRALALVLEWAVLHREEIREDWNKARNGEQPLPIDPLD